VDTGVVEAYLGMPKTYIAIYEPDVVDDVWSVRVDGVAGCEASARSLPVARERVRHALAWRLGIDPGEVLLEDRLPAAMTAVAKRANRARREAERAARRAQQESAQAVRDLAALGLSRRDSAAVLGLSHQRVQQLIKKGMPPSAT
jgi:hypothetical protein